MALNLGTLTGYLGLDVSDFEGGLDQAQDKLGDFGTKGKAVAAASGLAVAATFVGSLSGAMDTQAANAKLAAQLDLTGPESAKAGKMAGDLYAGNYGDSLEQVNEAVKSVAQNITGTGAIGSASMQDLTADVLSVASAFDQDLGGTTAAVGQLMKTGMAPDATSALDLITKGLQGPANKADDLLDTFNEYGGQFQKLGLDGPTALGLLQQGLQGGARDADVVADSLKEFSIRAIDGSKSSADAYAALGLSAKDMTEQIAKGGPAAEAGLGTVLEKLKGIKDPAQQAQIATGLFGTQAEDLGKALYSLDTKSATDGMDDVAGAAGRVNDTLSGTASSNLESFKRSMTTTFVNVLGGQVLPYVTQAATVIGSDLGPAISSAGAFIDDHSSSLQVLAAVLGGIVLPLLIAFAAQAVITGVTSAAAWVTEQAAFLANVASKVAGVATTVALYAMYAASAIGSALSTAAAWVASSAVIVGAWIAMGVQSLIQAARMAAAWIIAMGPIGLIIAAVIGLAILIYKNWDTIKAATKAIWSWVWDKIKAVGTAILTFFQKYTLPGIIASHWGAIKAAARAVWDWLSDKVKAVGNAVLGFFRKWTLPGIIASHWGAIRSAAGTAWGAITSFISGIPGKIVGYFAKLGSSVGGKFGDIKSSAKTKVDSLITWVKGIPGRVLSAVGNLGSLLAGAGRAIIQGLIDGVTAKFRDLQAKLEQVSGFIKDHKGPPSYDAVMLRPAGRLIIGGLIDGLEDRYPDVARTLGGLTGSMRVAGSLDMAPAGARSAAVAGAAGRSGALVNVETMVVRDETEAAAKLDARLRDSLNAFGLTGMGA